MQRHAPRTNLCPDDVVARRTPAAQRTAVDYACADSAYADLSVDNDIAVYIDLFSIGRRVPKRRFFYHGEASMAPTSVLGWFRHRPSSITTLMPLARPAS